MRITFPFSDYPYRGDYAGSRIDSLHEFHLSHSHMTRLIGYAHGNAGGHSSAGWFVGS